ncbi:hypothetical protein FPV67DRAFT_181594 [Lyophyllum atratum]|nr:hypothetical protein FPV67DRAFT_181594 [Lyophyllum atratum]
MFQADVSSLRHILLSNTPPSDPELLALQRLLHDVKVKLAGVVKEDGQHLHDGTYNSQISLENLAVACKSALSPLRRIPSEILSLIFYYTICDPPDNFLTAGWNSLDSEQVPSVLTKVCSSWRAVALAHRELWSHIWINLEVLSMNQNKPLPSPSKLKMFLERSGSQPLFIGFGDLYAPSSVAEKLFLLLLSQSRRWREVQFIFDFSRLQTMNQIRGRVPILRSLDLWMFGANTSETAFCAFEEAPQLREVFLDVGDPNVLSLPWAQLTALRGSFDFSKILQQSPSVRECFIPSHTPSSTVEIRHRKLRKLHINISNSLDWLEAPSLEDLRIFDSKKIDIFLRAQPKDVGHWTSFIGRSSCSLRSLSFTLAKLEYHDLRPLLESTPLLLRLEFQWCRVKWQSLARLLAITDSSCLVPHLQDIKIVFGENDAPGYLDISVIDLLEARIHFPPETGATRLKSAELLNMRDTAVEMRAKLRLSALQDVGLVLVQNWI